MKKKFITDVDFLPISLFSYLYKGKDNRFLQQEELYQLIFGILFHHNVDDIYQLLILLSSNQKDSIIRNVKLKIWKEDLQVVLMNLKKYSKINDSEIRVVLPYLWTAGSANVTRVINSFQWAINVIDEIVNHCGDLIAEKDNKFIYPLPPMSWFFTKFIIDKCGYQYKEEDKSKNLLDIDFEFNPNKLRKDGAYAISLKLWLDEMTRRGFNESHNYKSEYYDSEEYNYRKFYICEEVSDEELMTTTPLSYSHVEDNTTDKEKTAVIYFMLQDKVDKNTISTICNYVVGKKYNSNIRRKNSNSIDRYIRSCQKDVLDECDYTKEKMKNVAKILEEYEIEVPAKVKTFIEP